MLADNRKLPSFFDKSLLPWLICSIGMLFYCYNYFLRVSPSVMQHDLMQNLHISASQFGNLAAFYYYAYTPMQIPVGMIYDRFGARLVLFFACLFALLGLGIFISANNLLMASLGRFLIGFGTAFAYIGVLKLASLWLAPNRFATVAGLTTAFGMASAIFSDLYLTKFVQLLGYKNALYSALMVGVVLSFFILIFMRNKPKQELSQAGTSASPMTIKQLFTALNVVLANPQMWLIGLIGCLFYLPASVFLDLWGIPYLKAVYQITPEAAASIVSMTFVGWIIAGPSIGMLSDKIKRRRAPLLISALMSAILLSVVFYVPHLPLVSLYVLFFFIGIFCGAHPLCFALGKENNPNAISGTAVAVTNTLIMIGGVIFQPIVGKLLDWHANNDTGIYTASDYTYALSVVPLGLVVAIMLTFFLKETYCQSHEEVAEKKIPDNSNVYAFPRR
ncbi:MAG: MFS transporter [Gammaproteobacteria bacterium]|nr:MFS transporter [Gammaproteobacteria bacterium]